MTIDQTLALLALEIADLRARLQAAEQDAATARAELAQVKARKRTT